MTQPDRRAALEWLLDLCGRVERNTREVAHEVSPGRRDRLRARQRRAVRELSRRVASDEVLPPALAARARDLAPSERVLLLLLLARRIDGDTGPAEGRELVASLGRGSASGLRLSTLLAPGSPLLRCGAVEEHGGGSRGGTGGLEGMFRLSESVYLEVYRWFHGLSGVDGPLDRGPYVASLDHLLDLRHLVTLHQRRASVLFPMGYWAELHPDATESPTTLTAAIEETRSHIGKREAESIEGGELPVVALRDEMGLAPDEETILLALLFHELYAAPPLLEFAELVRLVAQDEADVLRKRPLVLGGSTLRDAGLMESTTGFEEPELLSDAFLPSWVTDRLLASAPGTPAIDRAERQRFHEFLERLDDSDDFYRQL